jgi:excisionase family DNA binding protein
MSNAKYTLREAATILGISATTLRVQLNRGRIEGEKRGRDWFLTAATVRQYQRETGKK